MASAGASAAPHAAALSPSITATPNTGLVQEDQVTVDGSGFVAGGIAVIEWCPNNSSSCRYSATARVEPTGAFSVDVAAEFRTSDASSNPSDCNTEGCFVRASQGVNADTITATAPASFDPNQESLLPVSLTVSPATALRDHDTVRVTGAGFETFTQVQQCALSAGWCRFNSFEPDLGADGSFALDIEVRRYITGPNRAPIDCAVVPCVILAEALNTPVATMTAPIEFDPSAPSTLPSVTVTPNTNLPVESTVTIEGRDFLPGELVSASECSFASVFAPCRSVETPPLTADATGAVTTTGTVRRLIPDTFGTGAPTDCAATGANCAVQLLGDTSGDAVSTPITFDPGSALPTMTVEPATNLPFRGTVTVRARDLALNTAYSARECAGRNSSNSACGPTVQGTSDGAGDLDLVVPIRRRLTTYTINELGYTFVTYDCVDAGVSCTVELTPTGGGDSLRAPITFDPAAPIPPPPTVAVIPATDIGSRQLVSVTGSGFLPDAPVALQQCDSRPTQFGIEFCVGSDQTQADAAGNINTTVIVRRFLSQGFSNPTDCSIAVGTCVLRVGSPGFATDPTEVTRAPLGFDPAAPPAPSPPVVVTPTTRLTNGQTVTVAGSEFTPNALIGIAMCRAGTTFSLLDCEITNPTWFPNDAHGAFTRSYDVRAKITTGNGRVDCTVAPGTCALGVVNINDYSEFTLVPVSFKPDRHHHHHHHHGRHHRHPHHRHPHRAR